VTYDLKSVSLPKLGSAGLRALVALIEAPGLGRLVLEKLRTDAGMNRLRDLDIAEPPTFVPSHPSDDPGIPPLDPFSASDGPYSDMPAPPPEPRGFHFPSVDDYSRAFRTGRATPESVAHAFLTRHRASNAGAAPLRAFIAVREDDVAAQAAASAARWKAGKPIGPWDGVPVAIKDEFEVAGYPLTLGTRILGGVASRRDATIVARLRAAGALIVGKSNMHEIGINITGLNPHYGTTRNPYDDGCHTGGSSSGSATAVASGLVPVAIGADGGGSIRIPSSFCGLVGIKPTFGRVSESGAAPLVWSVAFAGPIAAHVKDCAAAYALIAGEDGADPHSRGHPSVSVDVAVPRSLRGLRIGVFREWFRHAMPDVVARNEEMLDHFASKGAELVDVKIPELDLQRVAHVAAIFGEMAAAMAPVFPSRKSEFSLDARVNLASARSFTAAELVTAARMRTRAMTHWRAVLRDVHVVATPATACVAPRISPASVPKGGTDLSMTFEAMRFVFPSNLTGHPAISFPAGYDSAGMPAGMQVIGRPWSERLLFRIASMAELWLERRKPKRWYSPLDT
jgi:Asp-tRNA(Asn)/Glu-tRNA(Gln) amidotransferase A subunit family amidase